MHHRLRRHARLRLAVWLFAIALFPAATAQQAPAPSANPPPTADSLSAARATAERSTACQAIGDFYWEIGDAVGVQAGGAIGNRYGRDDKLFIASASKWIWGAYVVQRHHESGIPMSTDTIRALHLQTGYVAFTAASCALSPTVGICFATATNSTQLPTAVGNFSYGSGHNEWLAVALGLGPYSPADLTAELRRTLGADLGLSYITPVISAGVSSSVADYAGFLRKLIRGELAMRDSLGVDPVCTKLSANCPNARFSPVDQPWHYSYQHWVEDAGDRPDGSFSSPGVFGFYPWLSADKATYGVIGRDARRADAYLSSVRCGRAIRRAWFSGIAER